MRVILAQPRGFCAGVVRAIDTVEHARHRHATQNRQAAELAADAAEVTAP